MLKSRYAIHGRARKSHPYKTGRQDQESLSSVRAISASVNSRLGCFSNSPRYNSSPATTNGTTANSRYSHTDLSDYNPGREAPSKCHQPTTDSHIAVDCGHLYELRTYGVLQHPCARCRFDFRDSWAWRASCLPLNRLLRLLPPDHCQRSRLKAQLFVLFTESAVL